MSLFASEEEKTLSFDEYIASFDTNQIAKVQQFVDWLGQYRGELVHNPWGEVNPPTSKLFGLALMRLRCVVII